jgi:sec-independent protein translocase protein TatB
MNFLGVGPGELLVIFIIALVVAGPKRMIQWAYQIGRYTARIRAMAQETMNAVQKELAASGLDDVTKDLASLQSTKFDVMKEVSKIVDPALTPPAVEAPDQAQPAASAPSAPPQPAETSPAEPASSAEPVSPVEPASPVVTRAEPKTDGDAQAQNDDQTPRYGPWTPS